MKLGITIGQALWIILIGVIAVSVYWGVAV